MDNDFQIPIFVLYKASLQRGRNFIWLLLFPFICEWKVECNVKPLPWEAPVDVVTAGKVAVTFDHVLEIYFDILKYFISNTFTNSSSTFRNCINGWITFQRRFLILILIRCGFKSIIYFSFLSSKFLNKGIPALHFMVEHIGC